MLYNAHVRVYCGKASEFVRADKWMQCLLKLGWMLTDYSIQLDQHD